MKRLLCLISSMDSGGAETFLMKVYRALDRSKYQMDFCINVDRACFYSSEITSLGGKIYYIPPKSQSVKAFRDGLTRIVKDQRYQYVLRITSNAMGFMDLKIAKKAGAKVCSARSSNSSNGQITSLIAHKLGSCLYGKYVDVKFAPSDLAAKYTFGRTACEHGDVFMLHNAVDLDVFRYNAVGRSSVRSSYNIRDDVMIIGHVGRFAAQKNHGFLLDVFSELHRSASKTLLLLVGCGILEDDIRRKVHTLGLDGAVIFAGVRSDIPDILSAMDVLVFPSLYEGMPNTVIEAQATGLPCVSADTITREADIAGLVTYMPLTAPPKEWAEVVLQQTGHERMDTKEVFIAKKYDIASIANEFISLVFREGDIKGELLQ